MHENDQLQVQGGGYNWEGKAENEFKELKETPMVPIMYVWHDGG